jgi:hypothetical protein
MSFNLHLVNQLEHKVFFQCQQTLNMNNELNATSISTKLKDNA